MKLVQDLKVDLPDKVLTCVVTYDLNGSAVKNLTVFVKLVEFANNTSVNSEWLEKHGWDDFVADEAREAILASDNYLELLCTKDLTLLKNMV
jgi:hypothetical protein